MAARPRAAVTAEADHAIRPGSVSKLFGRLRPKRMMVVTAHPDDSDFVCGGTIALFARAGWEVDLLVATSGNKGTSDTDLTPQQLAGTREQEQRDAARILGIREPVFLGFPDGALRNDDELRGLIVREIRRRQPTVVITWDGYRRDFNHRDHRRVGRATYDAIYPAADDHLFYPEHAREGLRPHRPRVLLLAGTDRADTHLDIDPVLRAKARAVLAHASQVGARSEAELLDRWRERARSNATGGADAAPFVESFRKIEWPNR